MKHLLTLIIIVLAVVFFASRGCSSKPSTSHTMAATPIGKLLSSPHDYDDMTVCIKGKVTSSNGLGRCSIFVLNDGTGEISVMCSDFSAPAIGETVKISGRVLQILRSGQITVCMFKQVKELNH